MDDPNQFEINEAWIVFGLNDAPVQTEVDGDFNVIALMDAASGCILGMELVPVVSAELSELSARRLLDAGQSQAAGLPNRLLVPASMAAGRLSAEAGRLGIDVVRVEQERLSAFTGAACAGFKEHFGGRVQ